MEEERELNEAYREGYDIGYEKGYEQGYREAIDDVQMKIIDIKRDFNLS